ncbi:unnamed protein product [Aureobasidium uvarum]|uniref:Uncharacterized protein n=1 Tax=Aureobasidium uvarum TaxID=2773716 RepID=A0A9N8PRP9_9PEZI|nr:unnamed protein product [Aureobasidium uvarum]
MSAPQQGNMAGGKEDYVDKVGALMSAMYTPSSHSQQGLDSLEKKQGQDPNKLRSVNEKVTDTARGMFEKATGTSQELPDQYTSVLTYHLRQERFRQGLELDTRSPLSLRMIQCQCT